MLFTRHETLASAAAPNYFGHLVICIAAIGIASLVQGCSSTSNSGDHADQSRLIGREQTAAAQPRSAYDADAPPAAQPLYRGGRDPVSGRAQDWAPAAPAHQSQPTAVERSAIAPMPTYAPPPVSHPNAYAPPPQAHGAGVPRAAPQATASGPTNIEVRHGETLYRIARAHNVTVPALMQANGLTSETIRAGQRLNIPAQ